MSNLTIIRWYHNSKTLNGGRDGKQIVARCGQYYTPALFAALIQTSFTESVTIWTWRIRFGIKITDRLYPWPYCQISLPPLGLRSATKCKGGAATVICGTARWFSLIWTHLNSCSLQEPSCRKLGPAWNNWYSAADNSADLPSRTTTLEIYHSVSSISPGLELLLSR